MLDRRTNLAPGWVAVNFGVVALIRGSEFKSFTPQVKVYERIHRLGCRQRAAPSILILLATSRSLGARRSRRPGVGAGPPAPQSTNCGPGRRVRCGVHKSEPLSEGIKRRAARTRE